MADKSFGVDQLDILGTGTPTISAPNQLNLDCNTVAISTSATVGQNLTVSANAGIASLNVTGITTVVNFNATGISTIAVPSNTNANSALLVTANGSSAYRFTGPGQDGSDDNPNIYLVRGQRYVFTNNSGGSHPFQIRVASGGAAYSTGVTNNGASSGNIIFNVQHDAPAQLYYQCTNHGGMVGNIYIVGGPQVISGVVTATSFVGDGSALTGITQTTINNNADNRLITGSGTANTLNGESTLIYDGTNLDIDSDSGHLRIGDDQDLDLYHNGSNGYLKNSTGQLLFRSGTHTFENAAGSTEYARINTSGQFLINTSDGTGAYHLVVANPNNSDTGMTFRGSTASQQRIRFADGTSGGAESIGQVEYNHADNSLAIDTNGAEAVRIDSSGRVMIQTTTEGHADSDDLTIGDTGDNRIGITIRSSEYGNIFFSDATSGAAEYQGVLQYHHTDNVFNLSIGGGQKVTVGANNIALFGADNLSARGNNYYGVDLAYKGSGIQGRSNNPTLDICSNVYFDGSSVYKYGEGSTTAGQLSIGGNQLIFSSAGSGTAGATATLTEKFRFNLNNTMIFGSTTSNISNGIHLANGMMRFQAANQSVGNFTQQVGIEWSQEAGSDVQVGKIVMRRDAWGGAPHNMDFYTRTYQNQVTRALILHHNQSATLTGTLTQSGSDIRLKENITQIPNALTKVNSLTGFTYNWNKTAQDLGYQGLEHDDLQVGLSAQDVEKIQPEVIKPMGADPNYKTIQYEKLVPLLVESIKELSAKNTALEARIAALEGS